MSDLLIGTSGYDYPEWKGVFYPEDLKRKDFLIFYVTQFNALELNNTFYNTLTFYNGSHKTRNWGVFMGFLVLIILIGVVISIIASSSSGNKNYSGYHGGI